MNTLDLVVPCYNEADVLDMFFAEVVPVLESIKNFDFRLIMVNDGSRDNTINIIKSHAQRDSRVKYISFSRNFGKEAAMLAGLSYSSAEYVGIIDADLQHSPSMIPEMLDAVTGEYDVAAAKRIDRNGEGKLKSKLSDTFYKVVNKLSEVEIDSGAQDYRIMRRKVVDAILSMSEYNRFTKGIFSFVGFKTKWFPHENRERAAGETKWSFKSLLKYAFDGILAFSNKPLMFAMWLGMLFSATGVAYLLVLLILSFTSYASLTPLFHVIIALMFLIGGIILCCLGIAGEYVGRIYSEVRSRPVFIIDETNAEKND